MSHSSSAPPPPERSMLVQLEPQNGGARLSVVVDGSSLGAVYVSSWSASQVQAALQRVLRIVAIAASCQEDQ